MAAPWTLSGYARTVGATCKFTLRQLAAQEQIWNGSAFETYAVANIATYGITATIAGSGSLLRFGNVPTPTAGFYLFELWELAGASLTLTDDLCYEGFLNWTGTDVVAPSGSIVNNAFSFSPVESANQFQTAVYYKGAGVKIRFTADPPQAIDVSNFAVDIGAFGNYDTFTEANSGLVAVDEVNGIFDCNPTAAQSNDWPLEDCIVQAWRTDTDDNRIVMFNGKLIMRRTLRGSA